MSTEKKDTKLVKYGAKWDRSMDPLLIELRCIQYGGVWTSPSGAVCGAGMFEHYMNARKLIWPQRYRHRWTDLAYKTFLDNQITIMMGCASSGKSGSMAELALITYWASPDNTAVLVSSTTREKLEAAIYGEIKMLWLEGNLRYKWLAGHPIEYKQCITTDNKDEVEVRDFRRGIVCKAVYVGNNYTGIGALAGLKQHNLLWCCDEVQFMAPTLLDAVPNLRSNINFKMIGSGNPDHNPESQLGIAAEPLEGWASREDSEKTVVWPIRLSGGVCINFIGTDSPNFVKDDGTPQETDIYPRLIGHAFEKTLRKDYGKDSPKYESQIKGRMKMSLAKSRVITRQICRDHGAHDKALWKGTARTKIHACDPAYGGGDRCISGWGEFGESIDGKQILRVVPPRVIRINLKDPRSPEDQIAESIKRELEDHEIPTTHSGYDSFGKGTIGAAFAKVFGSACPTPIDAGQRPTKRPVRADLFVVDDITKERRLKRCDEEYGKFITEMWFAVRNIIDAGQMRELPEDVMTEGCWREYMMTSGNKIDVEPKPDMKERTGKSPDLFDWIALLVEMARKHGFKVGKLGENVHIEGAVSEDFFEQEAQKFQKMISSKLLQRA